jgi:CheY-like chemotaxis protein
MHIGRAGWLRDTVLIVDDDRLHRGLTASIVRASVGDDVRVVEAAGGEEALLLLGRLRDAHILVITDLVMPDCDGLELLRRASAEPDRRFVVFSSRLDAGEVAMAAGAARFENKPMDLVAFESVLADIVHEWVHLEPLAEAHGGKVGGGFVVLPTLRRVPGDRR